jgi:threonine/homoserine/homoserine lactone efflux protein
MTTHTLLLFAPACFALAMAFGPNNLLAVSGSMMVAFGLALAAARHPAA